MKGKILTLLFGWMSLALNAQDYQVSTAVQQKNVLLEEFTGVYCGYCVDGHQVAHQLQRVWKDRISVVAVHSGPFAPADGSELDMTIPEGIELADLLGAAWGGFPNGAVNRRIWNNSGKYYYGRSFWEDFADRILEEKAPVNLWAEAEYDAPSRKLSIRVEGYYTEEIPGEKSFLNVYLTQNNIVNWQSGSGRNYLHQQVLREMITGLKGEALPAAKKGEYFVKEYEYQVPEQYKKIAVDPVELEVVAFVTQSDQEVLNALTVKPAYVGEILPLKASVHPHQIPIAGGYRFDFVELELANECNTVLTSAGFEVSLNGQATEVAWKGEIPAFQRQLIRIPVDWQQKAGSSNTYQLTLKTLNGEAVAGNSFDGKFGQPTELPVQLTLHLNTDEFAAQNSYRLYNMQGEVLKTFGPFENGTCHHYEEALVLEPHTTYCLEITDSRGNGYYPRGNAVEFHNADDFVLFSQYGVKDFGTRLFFHTGAPTGIAEVPGYELNAKFEVYDLLGKWVMQTSDLKALPKGVYIVRSGDWVRKVMRQ